MAKNKMKNSNNVSNRQSNQVTDRKNQNVTDKNNNRVTDKKNNQVTDSKRQNIGFEAEDHSFELDEDSEHSFKLRDCK